MRYKDIDGGDPRAKTRELRRIWKVKVYVGDPDADDPETKIETVIAWNQVDANRKIPGQLAELPTLIGYVTWPRKGEEVVYIISNTTEGPIVETPITPTVGGVNDEEDAWNF